MRFLLIFIMFACSLSAFTQNISSQVDSVVIKYVSWDLITDISVDCTNYEACIDYKIYSESTPHGLKKLMKELNKLNMSSKSGEDIRCKLEFFFGGKICQTICVGDKLTKIDANYYATSSKLKSIIEHIVKTKREIWKSEDISWNPNSCIRKFYQYLSDYSGRLYNNLIIDHDLNIIVSCNIHGGKTVEVRFSRDKNQAKVIIPEQITSAIKDILYQKMVWDTPSNYKAQWVSFNVIIKANKS